MLLSSVAIAAVSEIISSSDVFYRPSHAHIFDVVNKKLKNERTGLDRDAREFAIRDAMKDEVDVGQTFKKGGAK